MPDKDTYGRNLLNDILNGTTAVRQTLMSGPNIVFIGDSITAFQGYLPVDNGTSNAGSIDARSWFGWANAIAGSPFTVLANLGVSGATSATIINQLPDALALKPTAVMIMAGTNDNPIGASTITNLKIMFDRCRAASVYVFAMSILPQPLSIATQQGGILSVNYWISQYWQANSGGEFVDAFGAVIDPTSTTQGTLAGALESTTSTHLTNLGALYIGRAMAPALSKFATSSHLATSAGDNFPNNPLSNILSLNPTFQGTAGALGTGVTGSAVTGFTCLRNGGAATAVASIVDDPNGFGKAQQLDITASAFGDKMTIQQNSYINLNTGGISPGQYFYLEGYVTVKANPVNLVVICAYQVASAGAGNVPNFMWSVPAVSAIQSVFVITSDLTFTYRTPLQISRSGDIRYLFRALELGFSNVGSATVILSRPAFRLANFPYTTLPV